MGKTSTEAPSGVQLNQNLIQACKRVNSAWFPVNPTLLSRIQDGISSGAYDLSIDFLIGEIKKDFALFMYCLREARLSLARSGIAVPGNLTPSKLLELTGIDTLKEILSIPPTDISEHEFDTGNPDLRIQRIQESMISATTAETMAEKTEADPELSYSAGLLRQLGLTLIAWNYPQIYKRAVSNGQTPRDTDRELTRTLGFSPKLLGIAMARQWGLCPEIRAALGDREAVKGCPQNQQGQVADAARAMSHLCEVGEALARASAPELYPTARHDWKYARDEISEILGNEGIGLIQQRLKENCESYLQVVPQAFSGMKMLQREPEPHTPSGNILEKNRYIKSCPSELAEALIAFYQGLSPDSVSQSQLNLLIREIIPQAGFANGCIFLLEPDEMKLVPRVKIGKPLPERARERSALSISTTGADDPVIAAYNCNTPIVESKTLQSTVGTASIAAVLGRSQRAGVMYLEVSADLLRSQSINPLLCFKAVCQALCDCLKLR
jgi:hypothetical protein